MQEGCWQYISDILLFSKTKLIYYNKQFFTPMMTNNINEKCMDKREWVKTQYFRGIKKKNNCSKHKNMIE